MSTVNGFLQNRLFTAVVVLGCSYAAAGSWLSFSRHSMLHRSEISSITLLVSVFIAASLALRATLTTDRMIFGGISAAFALALLSGFINSPEMIFAIVAVKSALWTLSAVLCAIVLVRGL